MGSHETWVLGLRLEETLHCLEPGLVSVPATWALPALRLPNLNSWCSFHWWLQRQETGGLLATTLCSPGSSQHG